LNEEQGIGLTIAEIKQYLLNFIADLYTSQTKTHFYILTSNPQIIRGNLKNWKITRFGHASKGNGDTRINEEIEGSLSRRRITVSLHYFRKTKKIKKKMENAFYAAGPYMY
jgi:hypothetical protein